MPGSLRIANNLGSLAPIVFAGIHHPKHFPCMLAGNALAPGASLVGQLL